MYCITWHEWILQGSMTRMTSADRVRALTAARRSGCCCIGCCSMQVIPDLIISENAEKTE